MCLDNQQRAGEEKRDEIGYNISLHKHHIVSERRKKYILTLKIVAVCPSNSRREEKRSDFFFFSAFKHTTNFIHEMLIS